MSAFRWAFPALALLLVGCGFDPPMPSSARGHDRAPWVLDAVSGPQLDLRVIHGCSRMAGVDAIESADRVEMRAWVDPNDDDRCFTVLLLTPGRVVLEAPLGTKELVKHDRTEPTALRRSGGLPRDRARGVSGGLTKRR